MLNKAQIIGRLGKDPEIRYMPSGEAVCNFSVATSEKWKDKNTGEAKEETTWHRVTAFGRLAEIVGEYLSQGSLVYVEGKMTQRRYTDNNGAERTSHEIRMSDMKMLGSKSESQGGGSSGGARPQSNGQNATRQQRQPAPAGGGSGFDDMDDDIPF